MNKSSKDRLCRSLAASIIASDLSVGEIERLLRSKNAVEDIFVNSFEMALSSLSYSKKTGGVVGTSARTHSSDVVKMIESGLLTKDALIEMLMDRKVLNISESTMRRMPIRQLVERANSAFEEGKFSTLRSGTSKREISDPYLREIEKSRSSR